MTARKRQQSRRQTPSKIHIVILIAILALFVIAWQASHTGTRHVSTNKQETQTSSAQTNTTRSDKSTHAAAPYISATELLHANLPQGTTQEIIEYPGFTVSYNKDYHNPNYVAWQLLGSQTDGNIKRSNKFVVDESVKGCATDQDYRNSGYDRGHMFPAADAKYSERTMDACFYLTNICPQDHSLNNGAWKRLEETCRKWAIRDSAIIIISGPVLTDRLTTTIGSTKVAVPKRFFKVILAPYANPPRAIGFVMDNGYVQGGIQNSALSVDQVEAITGIDFFAALPDSIENIVESQCNFPLWQKLK
jgi:endonuclease G